MTDTGHQWKREQEAAESDRLARPLGASSGPPNWRWPRRSLLPPRHAPS